MEEPYLPSCASSIQIRSSEPGPLRLSFVRGEDYPPIPIDSGGQIGYIHLQYTQYRILTI
jgi:hypothetical protein